MGANGSAEVVIRTRPVSSDEDNMRFRNFGAASWLLSAAVVALVGCERQAPEAPVVFGPASNVSELATRGLGESCVSGGDCATGLCARVTSPPFCTQPCGSVTPCPEGWRCGAAGPNSAKAWCLRP